MIRLLNRSALLVVAMWHTTIFAEVPAEDLQVRESFQNLQTSLKQRDVNASLEKLSSKTKDYYELLSQIAQNSDETDLSKLSPLNRLMVETVKGALPPSFWKDKDPSILLQTAIAKGLVGRELTDDLKLGNIQIDGDKASAELLKDGKLSALKLGFRREAGNWKVHLLSLFEQANAMTEAIMKRLGMNNEEFAKGLKSRFGKKPTANETK
jgi:hypothetical protein